MKEYAVIIAATIAALASIASLILSTRLTYDKEKRRILWVKEFDKFMELEETAGILTEDLLSYNCRTDEEKNEYYKKASFIRNSAGRFMRYPGVSKAIRELSHCAGWYFSQDMKHEGKEQYEEARADLERAYRGLVAECDKAMARPKQH